MMAIMVNGERFSKKQLKLHDFLGNLILSKFGIDKLDSLLQVLYKFNYKGSRGYGLVLKKYCQGFKICLKEALI